MRTRVHRTALGASQFVRDARYSDHACTFTPHDTRHVFQVVDRIALMRHGAGAADDSRRGASSVEVVERIITGTDA